MGKVGKALGKSPINYFSDLFIAAMVLGWAVVLVVMVGFAAYATVCLGIVDIWANVTECVTIPLGAGGAIWMIKNSVQHAIANNRGERAHEDFPAVDESIEIGGLEKPLELGTDEKEEEVG